MLNIESYMDIPENIHDDLVSYLVNEQDGKSASLTEWLATDAEHVKIFNRYVNIWNESESYMKQETFDTEKAWMRIHAIHQKKEIKNKRIKNISYVLSGIAASFLIMFVLSDWGILGDKTTYFVSMNADYGNRSEITLPDGSVVKLNAGSDIVYSYNPETKIREVNFQGEGFFDIAKCKEPFIIKLENDLQVKVLGTSFNLRAYADEQTVHTSLVKGCIEINHTGETLRMQAGEMAVFDKITNQLRLSEGVLAHTYAWLENKLYLDNMSLHDVCKYLERWYNVEITLEDGLGDEIRYNGVIKEESIQDVLDALCRLSNIEYHMKGKNIQITTK